MSSKGLRTTTRTSSPPGALRSGSNPWRCYRPQHQNPLANFVRVLEGDTGQPVDAEEDMVAGIFRPGRLRPCPAARRYRRKRRRNPSRTSFRLSTCTSKVALIPMSRM